MNCRNSPANWGSRSRFAICRPEPANGTGSNTACSLYIRQNWCGKPLRTLATIVSFFGATTTSTGLNVYCDVDENDYPNGVAIEDAQMEALDIRRAELHGEWNYTFLPTPQIDAVFS